MQHDIRSTHHFASAEKYFRAIYEPAFGKISWASEVSLSPRLDQIAFIGQRLDELAGSPLGKLCLADVSQKNFKQISDAPNDDRAPRWNAEGTQIAFLSDRAKKGIFGFYFYDLRTKQVVPGAAVEGTIEYLSWSPDGSQILLGVAGTGAESAGAQGSGSLMKGVKSEFPSWMPTVDVGLADDQWRKVWVFDLKTNTLRQVSPDGINVWEASWCGENAIIAIVSDHPGEASWYTARLIQIDLGSGTSKDRYCSPRQLGLPAASPDGDCMAFVQAFCSDRTIIAGDVLIAKDEGNPRKIDTLGVDATHIEWTDNRKLFFIGLRGHETVACEYDLAQDTTREIWKSSDTSGERYPIASAKPGSFALNLHGYHRYCEIALIQDGKFVVQIPFRHAGADYIQNMCGKLESVAWQGRDGLEIQGYLIQPRRSDRAPPPLVVAVHGGPVWAFRNSWNMYYYWIPPLVQQGYAIFLPNPRGSGGRGQAFAEGVYEDMGGKDAQDILAGVEALIEKGVVDPKRIAVMGGSYGGFMASWLVTQSRLFATAIPMSSCTNWYSFHFTTNIPFWDRYFMGGEPAKDRKYFDRSPVFFADQVEAPVLHIAGALDLCTPASQDLEFHRALLEKGKRSVLVVYPEEGHGNRGIWARIDCCARILDWLQQHLTRN